MTLKRATCACGRPILQSPTGGVTAHGHPLWTHTNGPYCDPGRHDYLDPAVRWATPLGAPSLFDQKTP